MEEDSLDRQDFMEMESYINDDNARLHGITLSMKYRHNISLRDIGVNDSENQKAFFKKEKDGSYTIILKRSSGEVFYMVSVHPDCKLLPASVESIRRLLEALLDVKYARVDL